MVSIINYLCFVIIIIIKYFPGSPFHFTVGPITDGVANKVRAMGSGLQEGWTHITNEFSIYTREAGAGTLSIAMEGPSKAEIDCDVCMWWKFILMNNNSHYRFHFILRNIVSLLDQLSDCFVFLIVSLTPVD